MAVENRRQIWHSNLNNTNTNSSITVNNYTYPYIPLPIPWEKVLGRFWNNLTLAAFW